VPFNAFRVALQGLFQNACTDVEKILHFRSFPLKCVDETLQSAFQRAWGGDVQSDNLLAGAIAVELGFVTQAQLDGCIREQDGALDPRPVGTLLMRKGHINADQLKQLLAEQKRRIDEFPETSLFGQLALQKGCITPRQLGEAIREQLRSKTKPLLGEILLRKTYITRAQFAEIITSQGKSLFECPKCKSFASLPTSVSMAQALCPSCRQMLSVVDGTEKRSGDTTMFFKVPLARLGKFEIVGEIARGAMGIVFKAHDASLDRTVALKVLKEGDAGPEFLKRLHREASLAAKLRHPNIVPIYEVGQCEGLHYLCMDFIEGCDLARYVETKKLDRRAVLSMIETVARAVHYAHTKGVIHRDLKPSNILVNEQGVPFLTDFGLAKSLDDAAWMTKEGAAVGTPLYMPPEQVLGQLDRIDQRSDVYSLGVLLYDLLVGRPPFTGVTTLEIYQKILSDDPVRPASLAHIPPDLEAIVLKAMEKDRDLRYATAEDLAFDLGRFLAGEPVMASRSTAARRFLRKVQKHSWRIGSIALTLAGALIVLFGVRAMEHSSTVHALESEASRLYDAQKFEEARSAYAKLLDVDPRHVIANQRIGELRRRIDEERASASRRLQDDAIARDREAKAKRQQAAKPYYDAGFRKVEEAAMLMHQPEFSPRALESRYEEASHDFTSAIERDPDYADAYFLRGRCAIDLGRVSAAAKDFTRAIELSPGNPSAYLERGKIHFIRAISLSNFKGRQEEGRIVFESDGASPAAAEEKRKAAADFQKAIDVSQRRDDRALMSAFMALADGDSAAAVRHFTTSIAENEANPDAYYGRGFAHLLMGDFDLALRFFQDAVRLKPNLYNALSLSGLASYALGKLDDAEKYLRRALAAGNDRLAMNNLAILYHGQRRYDEAIAVYDAMMRQEPDDVRVAMARASALFEKGDLEKATAAVETILARFPKNVDALELGAFCYSRAGNRDVALNYLEHAAELAASDDSILTNYAAMLLEDSQTEKALTIARKAAALNPKNAHAHVAVGACLADLGELDKALEATERALRLEPGYGRAHLNRGQILVKLGKKEEGAAELKKAAELDESLAPLAKRLLERMPK